MSNEAAAVIAGVVTLTFGGAGAYGGLAVIRNLHRLRDRLLKNFADRPGGWQRSEHHDPSQRTEGAGFRLSFEFVPKTPAQARLVGWVFLLTGLLMAALGLLIVVAALFGEVE